MATLLEALNIPQDLQSWTRSSFSRKETGSEKTYHCPLVIAKAIVIVDDRPPTVPAAFQLVEIVAVIEGFVRAVALRKFLQLHERRRRLSAITGPPPVLQCIALALEVELTEELSLLVRTGDDFVDLIIIHVASLFVLLFLISFEDGTL